MKIMMNCIPSSSITFLKKSFPIYSPSLITKTSLYNYSLSFSSHLTYISTCCKLPITNLPLTSISASSYSTFTTPPEFPSRRSNEIDPSTHVEVPEIPNDPDEYTVTPEPEIKPPIVPPPDPTPNPPGPDLPEPPIPSPPGPEIYPPPDAPPPRQPPDVIPPNAPEILPPPSTPTPDIIPPMGPIVV